MMNQMWFLQQKVLAVMIQEGGKEQYDEEMTGLRNFLSSEHLLTKVHRRGWVPFRNATFPSHSVPFSSSLGASRDGDRRSFHFIPTDLCICQSLLLIPLSCKKRERACPRRSCWTFAWGLLAPGFLPGVRNGFPLCDVGQDEAVDEMAT